MEYIGNPVGRNRPGSDRMGRIDADRHPRHPFDHRYMREIHHVPVRSIERGFHPAQAENDPGVAFAGQILRCIQ